MSYFTSTRHLVGVGLALLGLVAYFLGWLGPLWLPIVIGLYAAGVLLTPARTRVDRQLAQESSLAELESGLHSFVRGLKGKVPPELLAQTQQIEAQLHTLLPRLGTLEAVGDPNAYTVRQIITDYLPGTFKNYLNIPQGMRAKPSARLGKSPDAVVSEQLELLSSTLERVSTDTISGDADAIGANGRFLKEKFGKPDLEL